MTNWFWNVPGNWLVLSLLASWSLVYLLILFLMWVAS
jgi:hypothetical protein